MKKFFLEYFSRVTSVFMLPIFWIVNSLFQLSLSYDEDYRVSLNLRADNVFDFIFVLFFCLVFWFDLFFLFYFVTKLFS